jgi:hypothetical protein
MRQACGLGGSRTGARTPPIHTAGLVDFGESAEPTAANAEPLRANIQPHSRCSDAHRATVSATRPHSDRDWGSRGRGFKSRRPDAEAIFRIQMPKAGLKGSQSLLTRSLSGVLATGARLPSTRAVASLVVPEKQLVKGSEIIRRPRDDNDEEAQADALKSARGRVRYRSSASAFADRTTLQHENVAVLPAPRTRRGPMD